MPILAQQHGLEKAFLFVSNPE